MSLAEQVEKLKAIMDAMGFQRDGEFYVSHARPAEISESEQRARSHAFCELARDFGVHPDRDCGIPNVAPPDDRRQDKYQQACVLISGGGLSVHHGLYHELLAITNNPPLAEKTITLNAEQIHEAFEYIEYRMYKTKGADKAALVTGICNTGSPIQFDVILADGKVEARDVILGAGERAVIQPGGEINRPANKKGVSTFDKLYNASNPIADYDAAEQIARERQIAFPNKAAIHRAMTHLADKNPGVDLGRLEIAFYEAKGKGRVARIPQIYSDIKLPQPTWGEDQSQDNRGGDILMLNNDGSIYMIGREEFFKTYIDPDSPGQIPEAFYESIPILDSHRIERCEPKIVQQVRNEKRQAQLAGEPLKGPIRWLYAPELDNGMRR